MKKVKVKSLYLRIKESAIKWFGHNSQNNWGDRKKMER